MDFLSLALGGAGTVILTVLALVVKQVLAKILSGGSGSGPGIVITNTGSNAAAEADNSGQHSLPPPSRRAIPSLAGIDQETTPTEWVAPARCEQLREQLERKLDERAEKSGIRLEGKMDGMVTEQRRMNDTLIRLTTLQEEAAKREESLGKRVERLESGARMPAAGRR